MLQASTRAGSLLRWSSLLALLSGQALLAQEKGEDLESILAIPVEIATQRRQKLVEAPSIVSVVTRSDIERYGYREMTDILRALPGFDFALDSGGLLGLAFRGIWAHEGKALVLVDGIAVSPLHNGNINWYGYLPADMVERVEVIRGPGSAVYGQFAGVTVIHIHTRGPEGLDGGRFAVRGEFLKGGTQGHGAYLSAGGSLGGKVGIAVNAGFQTSNLSANPYVDLYRAGAAYAQDKGNSRREATYVSATVEARDTRIQLLRSTYQGAQSDGSGAGPRDNPANLPDLAPGIIGSGTRLVQGVRISRNTALAGDWTLGVVVESIHNTGGTVYPMSRASSGVNHSGTNRERNGVDLHLGWTPTVNTSAQLGAGWLQDWERSVGFKVENGVVIGVGALRDPYNPSHLLSQKRINTSYAYGQVIHQRERWGLTVGARYQDNELGNAFAPRLGLTYVDGRFNAKFLYGRAFRAPTLFQAYSTFFTFRGFVKPERIQTREVEMGWRLSERAVVRVNGYHLAVQDAITSNVDGAAFYISNGGTVETRGLEATLDVRALDWGGYASLSYVEPGSQFDRTFQASAWDEATRQAQPLDRVLGLAPWKLNLGAYVWWKSLQVAPSLTYLGPRPMQSVRSAQQQIAAGTLWPSLLESTPLPGRWIVNLAATWKDALGPDTDLRLAASNLTDADVPIIQPYYGRHAPLPAHDRRVTLTGVWRF